MWRISCCPVVYVKVSSKKFKAFCPTRGGPFGEQLPIIGEGPRPEAVRVEVTPQGNESWAEIVEKAAKVACSTRCK
jgi:hypothetical protein